MGYAPSCPAFERRMFVSLVVCRDLFFSRSRPRQASMNYDANFRDRIRTEWFDGTTHLPVNERKHASRL